jgi:glycosyltransferase involved in cell wall biosynthesis
MLPKPAPAARHGAVTPLRVALVAPLVSPIDEAAAPLGGAQAMVAHLARGLARRGHRVWLLAASGSRVTGVEVVDLGIDAGDLAATLFSAGAGRPATTSAAQVAAFGQVRAWLDGHAGEVDLVHAHAYDAPAFDALAGSPLPVVHTLHLPPLDDDVARAARRASASATLVTVSRACAADWQEVGVEVDHIIPNRIDTAGIPFGAAPGAYVLCAGRVSPEKGTHVALRVARAAGRPLVVAGNAYDRAYFAAEVRPRIHARPDWTVGAPLPLGAPAVWVGHQPQPALHHLMAGALATLMPIQWDEPFGLVAVESQAAGAPLVGFARGALPEVVAEGRTGFLVPPGDEPALAGALGRAASLVRQACREWATTRFGLDRMVADHEAGYRSLVGSGGRAPGGGVEGGEAPGDGGLLRSEGGAE